MTENPRQCPPPWFDHLTPAQRRGAWCLRERMRVVEYLRDLNNATSPFEAADLIDRGAHWEYVPGETFDERWRAEVERQVRR